MNRQIKCRDWSGYLHPGQDLDLSLQCQAALGQASKQSANRKQHAKRAER